MYQAISSDIGFTSHMEDSTGSMNGHDAHREIDLEAVISFVSDRKKRDGGFAQAPGLPHTIEDTFYAISILQQIQRDTNLHEVKVLISASETIDYLTDSLKQDWYNIKLAFQLIYACKTAGIGLDILRRTVRRVAIADDIYSYYYGIKLFELVHEEWTFPLRETISVQSDRSTSREVLMLTAIKRHYNLPIDADHLSTWLKRCQTCDGGFGFYPGTTSYIENCHYCLKALSLIGSRPIDTLGVYNFILSCQTRSGGFARKNRGAPFLDATWHAISGLSILNAWSLR